MDQKHRNQIHTRNNSLLTYTNRGTEFFTRNRTFIIPEEKSCVLNLALDELRIWPKVFSKIFLNAWWKSQHNFLLDGQTLSREREKKLAHESFIYELINAHNVSKLIEERIQHCGDLFGREGYSKICCLQISTKVFDFKAPSLAGLPRHPLAPRMSIWDKCRQRNK